MTNERAFRGVWIPADLWLNRSLSIQEKVMLIEIDSLSKDPERGCYKKNQGFAEFFGLSKNRVSEIIKSLESKGFIRVHYQRQGKEIVERNIFIIAPFDKPTPPSEKCDNPFGKAGEPPSENREERGSSSRGSVEGSIMSPTGSVCSVCNGDGWITMPNGAQGGCWVCGGTGHQPVVNHELTTEQPPKADKPLNVPFDDFWNLYNKKVGRKKAETRWRRLTNKDRAAIMEHLPNYIRNTPDVQYRKNPETYLNAESWNDELPNMRKPGRPDYPENQGVDKSIHTKQMTGLASELTSEQRKAAQERIKAMLRDSE